MKRVVRFIKLFASEFWDCIPGQSEDKIMCGIGLCGALIGATLAIGRYSWPEVGIAAICGFVGIYMVLLVIGLALAILFALSCLIAGTFLSIKIAWIKSK